MQQVADLTIVPYEDKFAKDVWDLHLHIVKNHEGFLKNLDFYEDVREVGKHYKYFYLLKDNKLVVGMVGLKEIDGTTAEIKRLQVHKDYQKQGLGKKLLEKSIDCAKEAGYKKLVLDFDRRREYLKRLYEGFGFKKYDEQKAFMGPDKEEFDLILMERVI